MRKVFNYIEIYFRCSGNAMKVKIAFKNYSISKVLGFDIDLGFVGLKCINNTFEILVYSICEML